MTDCIDPFRLAALAAFASLGCYPTAPGSHARAPAADEAAELASCPGGRVDDNEDGNNQILPSAGRGGY